MKKVYISQRKLESYKRAEKVCREFRYQITYKGRNDMNSVVDYLLKWMDVTGKIKFKRPE